ncbi:hypothetical protein EGH23_23705 [Halomicroarcula sp. F27]|uniref:Alpha/beta hydrolase n=1 Tax=Haloarcula nitratireducens TaxID=2487749 RepID=A0AAW4PKP7_9EURY|nr:hypothetical protein [Halomicroarcula nitratireducens]
MAEATPPDTGGDMETVTSADGTEIAFERTGSGSPLVLVHGGVCDHRFWELSDIRATFADHFTVYRRSRASASGLDPEGEARQRFNLPRLVLWINGRDGQ